MTVKVLDLQLKSEAISVDAILQEFFLEEFGPD